MPAFEQSWENPPFVAGHQHTAITRGFRTELVADITTLALEDEQNYYLIVANNSGPFPDVSFRMKLPNMKGTETRAAAVLNENRARPIAYGEDSGEWVIPNHPMTFGDVDIWAIPKVAPKND